VHRPAYERDRDAIRAALGPEHFAALETEGTSIPTAALPALIASWRQRVADTEAEASAVANTR
jgi:hypothetical protein